MNLEVQAAALGIAGTVVGLTVMAARLTAWHARRHAVGDVGTSAGEPYILYFTTEQCSTCRTLQEPALKKLEATVRKVDAIVERELADRYSVFTVPSTVVIGADGTALHVNYGYATAEKLRLQLAPPSAPLAATG